MGIPKHSWRTGFVIAFFLQLLSFSVSGSIIEKDSIYFAVDMSTARTNEFTVSMKIQADRQARPFIDLRMPAWSPGYYQIMDFGKHLREFSVRGERSADTLRWVKLDKDTWRIYTQEEETLHIAYKVHTPRAFVATSYIDTNRAFIKPAALFLYPDGQLERPIHMTLQPYGDWNKVATGLDSLSGQSFAFSAPDYDILYDSPLLIGALQELPPFYVQGIKHRFIGYSMGDFDGKKLMDELKKIVESSVTLMGGDIPYPHYTFIGIGPGQGGIEQLNSTAISFQGKSLEGPGRLGMLSFIAHEYFHHYNVKRIRPLELGPFDYSKPNRTNLLWVAEGLTVYYENVILHRAGLMQGDEILRDWETHINNYENNQGKYNQTLAESSAQTWEDGPFGKPGKTISYYVKGPIIGMLLDLRIRTATRNQRSLDDVMRRLYTDYYKNKGRGFTDNEVIQVCEEIAGVSLEEIFNYIYTTEPINYQKYFSDAGLNIDFQEEEDSKGNQRIRATVKIGDQPTAFQKILLREMFGTI